MRIREGDLIETFESLMFDVKSLVHPPDRIIAFIRYFPDKKGKRNRKKKTFGKVYSLSKRYDWLKQNFPHYLVYDSIFDEVLCEVPVDDVKRHYKPVEKLRELRRSKRRDELENTSVKLTELLKKAANISVNSIGISGSIMAGLHIPNSDIDPIVYGSTNCLKVYAALKIMLKTKTSPFKPYNREDLKALFDFRSKDTIMSFEDFEAVESRKVLQGKFMERDYFIRFVKNWSEINEKYGDVRYQNVGYTKLKATIADDSEAVFTPCTYKISNVQILEGPKIENIEQVASFRGRFCEQARKGEVIAAQGKVERVVDNRQNREWFRLLLGNKPSDHMIRA